MNRFVLALVALGAAGVGAITQASFANDPPERPERSWIDEAALDPATPACSNFYRHACGGFIAHHPASPDQPRIAMTDSGSRDIGLDDLLGRDASDPELSRLKAFYASCRAAAAGKDKAGAAEPRLWLARIASLRSRAQAQDMIRRLQQIGVRAFISYAAWPDRRDWGQYRGELDAGILSADPVLVGQELIAAGYSASEARQAIAMMTRLRAVAGDRWDAATAANPISIARLRAMAPHLDWTRFFAMAGRPGDGTVNVVAPAYIALVDHELATQPLSTIRAYLAWSFLFSMRGELPLKFASAFAEAPANIRVERDAAKRCRASTVRLMGVELSRQYAMRQVGPEVRIRASEVATEIGRAMVKAAQDNVWLTPTGRDAIVAKLRRTDLKIGYPDIWPATGSYPVSSTSFMANVIAARRYLQRQEWSRIGAYRDRRQWDMQVYPWVGQGMAAARLAIANGFPDAYSNSLIMTAAFLRPPRFDPSAPPEVNYGSFGTILAHEFVHVAETHMFDAEGRERELWNGQDLAHAKEADACIIGQAEAYRPLPDIVIDGKRQFDENVADFGGVRIAFAALEQRLGGALYRPNAHGRSPAQVFFYRYAQNYCASATDAEVRRSSASDAHAQPEFRVNGPLSNVPGFARAFGCGDGSPMVRPFEKICRVW